MDGVRSTNQMTLGLDRRPVVAHQPAWAGGLPKEDRERFKQLLEQHRKEEARANIIDSVCAQYRQKGEVRLIKPQGSPHLHLFLREADGRFHCAGYFDERRCGIVFVSK